MFTWIRTSNGELEQIDLRAQPLQAQFAVGASNGPRSNVWIVKGSKHGDLFIGTRDTMHRLKLSLHNSGIRRLAWTKEYAKAHLPEGVDRKIAEWTPQEIAPGWTHEVEIWVAEEDVSTTVPVPGKPRSIERILWTDKPPEGTAVVFRIATCRLGASEIKLEATGMVTLTGFLLNRSNGPEACLILGSEIVLTVDRRNWFAERRHEAFERRPEGVDFGALDLRVIAIGIGHTSPHLVDLSALPFEVPGHSS